MSGVLWYNFLKAWRGDPGIVVATPDIQMRTIVQLAEKGAEKGNESCIKTIDFSGLMIITLFSFLRYFLFYY